MNGKYSITRPVHIDARIEWPKNSKYMAIKKKAWQINSFRCIYCDYNGEWITVYIYAENFLGAVKYISNKIDMWVIKEISANIENGEIEGKRVENATKFEIVP